MVVRFETEGAVTDAPPRRREAGPRPVTPAYLERAALHYLDRYASSAENLRRVLLRKAERRLGREGERPPALEADVAALVERLVGMGFVDDRSFADAKVGSLVRRGTSPGAMRRRLRAKGVADDTAAAALAGHEIDDLALARRHAERKRLGPYRTRPDPAARARDLASLCRAGFPYRVAVQALAGPDDPDRP